MRILALNCGSSSVKSALIDLGNSTPRRVLDAAVEEIDDAPLLRIAGERIALTGHADLVTVVRRLLAEVRVRLGEGGAPAAVVHRIVHGGERFRSATRIDETVLGAIESLSPLAPLHNPPALVALRVALEEHPRVPHLAVFDTAFHSTLPAQAREYALAAELRERFGIRRYGFHGINHAHVAAIVTSRLGAPASGLRLVSCHLGSGASITAIAHGRSVETSMGMTPLEGLVMGTRGGDVDPGALLHALRSGCDVERLDALMNEASGLTGLAGTGDMRQIELRAAQGDERAHLALVLYTHRIRKYIGAYAAAMGGLDAIAFTGGVGENSAEVRRRSLQRLAFLGAAIDEAANGVARERLAHAPCMDISAPGARVRVLVVRADEELEMALQAARLLAGSAPQ